VSIADTVYSARFRGPEEIEHGRANLLKCPTRLNGSAAVPSSGTVSVYNRAGSALVDAAAVTVSGSVAQYSLAAATVASEAFEEGWRVEWALVMPDGITHTFRTDGALVRRQLYPVITDADLFRRASSLDPSGTAPITSEANYQTWINEAWDEIRLRLISQGNRPNLILSPSALRGVHLNLTLAFIFEDQATRLNEAYQDIADRYRDHYESEWRRLNFIYDDGDTGRAEDAETRRSGTPTIWLAGGRARATAWRR